MTLEEANPQTGGTKPCIDQKKRLEAVRKERDIWLTACVVWLDRSQTRHTFILLRTHVHSTTATSVDCKRHAARSRIPAELGQI